MDEFFGLKKRDIEEANLVLQDCSNSVAMLRGKCCDLELSLTALHDPDSKVKLFHLGKLSQAILKAEPVQVKSKDVCPKVPEN